MRFVPQKWVSLPLLGCLLIGAAVFFIHTRHNQIPFWFRYDEEGKGRQVVEGYRNLHHPLLNVNVAAVLYRLTGPRSHSVQHAVVLGRIGAAAGIGLAALALAWLAWQAAGATAGVLTGLALILHPAFVYAGRFFKEDGLLVGTWALLLLALHLYQQRPGARTSLGAGLAAGLCASAKYVGLLPAVLGLSMLAIAGTGGTRRQAVRLAALYAVTALLLWAAINYALIVDWGRACGRMRVEIDLLRSETTTWGSPWNLLVTTSGWSGLLGLALYAGMRARGFRDTPRIEVLGLITAGIYGSASLLLERAAGRYFLPVWMVEWWLTAVGLGLVWRSSWLAAYPARKFLAWLALVALVYGPMAQRGWHTFQSFAMTNPRLAMAQYVDEQVPADAFVVYDVTVNLPDAARDQRQVNGFAPRQKLQELTPDLVTGDDMFASLKSRGVTHVVLSPHRIALFARPDFRQVFHRDPNVELRPAFYEAVRQHAKVVYVQPAGPDPYVAPELVLYRL